MFNQLLKKLIKGSAGRSRFVLAIVGLSVALILILAAVQLQVNYNDLLHSKTNQDSIANFLVINKKVTNETVGNTSLSDTAIAALKQQPFVDAVGVLTPSRFKVSASGSEQIPFYTDLFFESVPDDFIDVTNSDWKWDDAKAFVPIIVPNMFLDLYNFGFAASQNLPQLSQQLVMNLPIRITINSLKTGPVNYYAKVVGFSDRISSVLVPQTFMNWANAKFGSTENTKPSRVVIRTTDPGNPQLVSYLKTHNLTTDADKTRFSKYRQIVNAVVNISWVTGAIMLVFALLIFTLFIQLTIASSKDDIRLLITLGAAPKQLFRFLFRQFFPANIVIIITVLIIITLLQWLTQHILVRQHIYINPYISFYTIAAGLLVLIVLWFVNSTTINKYIKKQV